MAWEKKKIDKMEMMHLLGIIYARTSAGFGKVGLLKLIKEEGKPTLRGKCDIIVKALVRSGLLIYEGNAKYRRYKWNLKDYGPPSLVLVDLIIGEMRRVRNRRVKVYYHSKKKSQNQKEKANERNADNNRN
jgi:hypothetical protein